MGRIMQITIIVPMLNAEKYLDRCIQSLARALEAAGTRGEIVLMDNGSRDGTLKIAEKYLRDYPGMVRVLKCSTPGAGAARNFGMEQAEGKYVWFVDADDSVREDAVRLLLEEANRHRADMVMLGMERIYPDGHRDYLSAVRPNEVNFKSRFIRYGLGPVQVMVRRAWWEQHGFRFAEGVIQEDMELMSALILATDKYGAVDEPLYQYYQNPDSVLHKTRWNPHTFDIFPALEGLYERFLAAEAAERYHDELEWFFIWNLLIDGAKDFGKFPEGRAGYARTRKMLQRYFPAWRKNRFLRQKSWRLRLRVRLNYRKK